MTCLSVYLSARSSWDCNHRFSLVGVSYIPSTKPVGMYFHRSNRREAFLQKVCHSNLRSPSLIVLLKVDYLFYPQWPHVLPDFSKDEKMWPSLQPRNVFDRVTYSRHRFTQYGTESLEGCGGLAKCDFLLKMVKSWPLWKIGVRRTEHRTMYKKWIEHRTLFEQAP